MVGDDAGRENDGELLDALLGEGVARTLFGVPCFFGVLRIFFIGEDAFSEFMMSRSDMPAFGLEGRG